MCFHFVQNRDKESSKHFLIAFSSLKYHPSSSVFSVVSLRVQGLDADQIETFSDGFAYSQIDNFPLLFYY